MYKTCTFDPKSVPYKESRHYFNCPLCGEIVEAECDHYQDESFQGVVFTLADYMDYTEYDPNFNPFAAQGDIEC